MRAMQSVARKSDVAPHDAMSVVWDGLCQLRSAIKNHNGPIQFCTLSVGPVIECAINNSNGRSTRAKNDSNALTIFPRYPTNASHLRSNPDETVIAMEDVGEARIVQFGFLDEPLAKLVCAYLTPCFAPVWAAQRRRAIAVGHLAQTLDGKIATLGGDSKWIGGEENQTHAHRMRALSDAVLVGAKTLNRDKARLNVRRVSGPDPVRVVLGSSANLQSLIDASPAPIIVVGKSPSSDARAERLVIQPDASGWISPKTLLEALYQVGIASVYVEGGASTIDRFLEDYALDVLQVHIAPTVVGEGMSSFPRPGVRLMAEAQRLRAIDYIPVDDGIMLIARVPRSTANLTRTKPSQSFWHEGPAQYAIRNHRVAAPVHGWCQVEALYSAVSPGTERLIANGHVPPQLHETMRCPYMDGAFPYPVKYGYSVVGRVIVGPEDYVGKIVHALHPHQSVFNVRIEDMHLVPANVPAHRATLAANLETAVNAVWDARLALGQRVVIIGFGTIGSLIARVASTTPAVDLCIVESNPEKQALAQSLGFRVLPAQDVVPGSFDVAFHASGSEEGLQTALDAIGFEGTLIDVSWYGNRPVNVHLGGTFHSQRKRIVSSQVSSIASPMRARWTGARRMGLVMELLADDLFDKHISDSIAFEQLPRLFETSRCTSSLSILVDYCSSQAT